MASFCASSEIATSKGRQAKFNYDAPIDQWPCKALQCWLKARALTYSGLRKAQLVESYGLVITIGFHCLLVLWLAVCILSRVTINFHSVSRLHVYNIVII